MCRWKDTTLSPEQPDPASRTPAHKLFQCQCSESGSPCRDIQFIYCWKEIKRSLMFLQWIHSHLHVPETLDAKQSLVLCWEQDVGFLVESCENKNLFQRHWVWDFKHFGFSRSMTVWPISGKDLLHSYRMYCLALWTWNLIPQIVWKSHQDKCWTKYLSKIKDMVRDARYVDDDIGICRY